MGTTIRREPVNFAIPASPNYKFLNITNFRGLDVSSNPFELANNTASDCLNVYVDETNTLTTRPRLERKITHPMDGTHIATYNLHNGYLLHYLVDGAGVMKTLIDGVLTDVTGKDLTPDVEDVANKQFYEIPSVKCEYFEQGDKIYLLDGERYMVVLDNVLSDVEGYVPTVYATDINGNKNEIERVNLLSTKIKNIFFWDGINSPYGDFTIDYKNSKNKKILKANITTDLTDFKYIQQYTDNSILLLNTKTRELYYGLWINNFSQINLQKTGIIIPENSDVVSASDTKTVCVLGSAGQNYYLYNGNGSWKLATFEYGSPLSELFAYGMLSNGSLWTIDKDPQKNVNYLYINNNEEVESLAIGEGLETPNKSIKALNAKSQKDFYPLYCELQNSTERIFRMEPSEFGSREEFYFTDIPENAKSNLSESGKIYYIYWSDDLTDVVIMYDTTLKTKTKHTYPKGFINTLFRISDKYNIAYWLDSKNTMWVAPLSNLDSYYNTLITFDGDLIYDDYFEKFITIQNDVFMLYFDNKDSSVIETIADISPNDDYYDDWQSKREQFFQSYLNTRFDNNYWFASKNRYYRSANNDPTYFPITEYNDLGDSNEEITGFNLANDTTLIAYKKNRVYLIQPFTSSLDTTEYAITESKNTVGNTAFGSPIVTTLTEIPLQINNDGIYGLSQLSNVSATERIADLMSEPINERWLNIDDTLITNAQTLNRLYWTYIILPDNKQTMIYLLDNRSNSWYYWELPIVVSDSFVKDNRAEFVDVAGNIYYLTTTDIIDINYDEEKVTKYYDDGEQLIPWFWQSQVLPMGTMNYSKRLVNTTFILTDTDDSDGYGLQYNFKVFRKLASSTPEKEISDKLTLVRSTTKKTNISKFGFLQMRISNLTEESRDYEAYENNKLRLVGLGLKYVLLEGLIR